MEITQNHTQPKNDISRSWCLNVKNKLINLGSKPSDATVFMWHFDKKFWSIFCKYVDDFLFGGNEFFRNYVNEPLKSIFTIGSEF